MFYPTYYSLLVVVSTIFFNLQTEVEEWMKTLDKGDREANRWHAVSALCLLIGLFAALLYALPYIADIQGASRTRATAPPSSTSPWRPPCFCP